MQNMSYDLENPVRLKLGRGLSGKGQLFDVWPGVHPNYGTTDTLESEAYESSITEGCDSEVELYDLVAVAGKFAAVPIY